MVPPLLGEGDERVRGGVEADVEIAVVWGASLVLMRHVLLPSEGGGRGRPGGGGGGGLGEGASEERQGKGVGRVRMVGNNSRQNIIVSKRVGRIFRLEALDTPDRVPFDQDPGTAQLGMLADVLIVQIVDGALGGDVVDLEVGSSDNVTLVWLA